MKLVKTKIYSTIWRVFFQHTLTKNLLMHAYMIEMRIISNSLNFQFKTQWIPWYIIYFMPVIVLSIHCEQRKSNCIKTNKEKKGKEELENKSSKRKMTKSKYSLHWIGLTLSSVVIVFTADSVILSLAKANGRKWCDVHSQFYIHSHRHTCTHR